MSATIAVKVRNDEGQLFEFVFIATQLEAVFTTVDGFHWFPASEYSVSQELLLKAFRRMKVELKDAT